MTRESFALISTSERAVPEQASLIGCDNNYSNAEDSFLLHLKRMMMIGVPIRKLSLRCTKVASRQTVKRKRDEGEKEDGDGINRALSTAFPDTILCRESECGVIRTFLTDHLKHGTSGSLYVSGPPGTGKSVCVTKLVEEIKDAYGVKSVFVNCMEVMSPRRSIDQLKKFATVQQVVVIVDELDALDVSSLYKLFEYPSTPNSQLILIGIANALDLTERVLCRIHLRDACKPMLLHFNPYTKEQIQTIIQARMKTVSGIELDSLSIEFCSRKVAAVTGDIRKALSMCRRAVEQSKFERNSKRRRVENNSGQTQLVSLSNMMSTDWQSRSSLSQPDFPLQQKLTMCTILVLWKEKKRKMATLGELYNRYRHICLEHKVDSIDRSDFVNVCSLLEARGVLCIGKAKEVRLRQVQLMVLESELHRFISNEVFVQSILSSV
ncbi:cell division control protein 6 homolog [Corticium candelabrum]|uniref:cell division control protein 6 homolog n=1 Tax=Corticium candelabrum TaxID=121492 RepID=UPI002E25F52E|nr:cell division control protein 6 homolog [Corticium candelabrum]